MLLNQFRGALKAIRSRQTYKTDQGSDRVVVITQSKNFTSRV
jgi:hypothetical protein